MVDRDLCREIFWGGKKGPPWGTESLRVSKGNRKLCDGVEKKGLAIIISGGKNYTGGKKSRKRHRTDERRTIFPDKDRRESSKKKGKIREEIGS